jgi:hypothetical protein
MTAQQLRTVLDQADKAREEILPGLHYLSAPPTSASAHKREG